MGHSGAGQAVNSHDVNAFHIINLAENQPAYAAKTVDGNFTVLIMND